MLCIWWDCRGVIYWELLGMNETIDSTKYCEQLDKLNENLKKMRPSLVNRKGVTFHQDNARPHTSKITSKKIKDLGWEVMEHPPYSPDIAPTDFHLFRSLQHFLCEKRFQNEDEIKEGIKKFIASKSISFFEKGIRSLVDKWQTIIDNNGEYIIE